MTRVFFECITKRSLWTLDAYFSLIFLAGMRDFVLFGLRGGGGCCCWGAGEWRMGLMGSWGDDQGYVEVVRWGKIG